jgi:hypothetical protein
VSHAGEPFRSCLTPLSYRALLGQRSFKPGAYIFSQIDQFSRHEATQLAVVWSLLANSGSTVLNHPTRSLRRYELLRRLNECGINDFNVYRLTESRKPQRFPVFVRNEEDHFLHDEDTLLLRNQKELETHLESLDRSGECRENKLIIEFSDTSDGAGIFRKFAAFRIGEAVIPFHLHFRREWIVPGAGELRELTPDMEMECVQFARNNPHESRLREIFDLARLDYGRIDYSYVADKIRVWEINTHPVLPARLVPMARDSHWKSERNNRIKAAFESLSIAAAETPFATVRNPFRELNAEGLVLKLGARCPQWVQRCAACVCNRIAPELSDLFSEAVRY